MHILFLTDNFPPEGNAPASRTYEHVREWVKEGHKVTVITCAPNFPDGKVFPQYKNKWLSKESIEGIEIWRVKTYITANEGFLKRTLDFVSFMISSFFFGLFSKKIDIVVGTSPQFFTVISAWALAKFKRVPFVFELRDIWPASITAVGAMKKSKVINILERIEMFLYRQADAIISVTHSFKSELIERGVDIDKIHVVLNGVDLAQYSPRKIKDPIFAKEFNLEGKFVAGYVGTHGLAHALDKLVDAASLLKDRDDIRVLFAGGGADRPRIEQLVAESQLNNIVMIPRQPKDLMPKLWSLCDASIISLKDTPLFKTVIPSKIFESMGMGLPMIIAAPPGEATEIVQKANSGLVVAAENEIQIADAITTLANDNESYAIFESASYESAKQYDRKVLASKMIKILEKLV
ncbi:glycosyltransferase family 4 protein [Kangiella sp. HZ709]|uniref:glycosyltransferase family 4 protein n=1 Tax=Kangiella sp. HZ709 TaxID=2666328 RepID=UPI00141693A2|nr:glycosyltransferase [Kangiella sp. HZ709]